MELTHTESDTGEDFLFGSVVGWRGRSGLFDVYLTQDQAPDTVTLESPDTFFPNVPVNELLDA